MLSVDKGDLKTNDKLESDELGRFIWKLNFFETFIDFIYWSEISIAEIAGHIN